jgi:hypothetical protein
MEATLNMATFVFDLQWSFWLLGGFDRRSMSSRVGPKPPSNPIANQLKQNRQHYERKLREHQRRALWARHAYSQLRPENDLSPGNRPFPPRWSDDVRSVRSVGEWNRRGQAALDLFDSIDANLEPPAGNPVLNDILHNLRRPNTRACGFGEETWRFAFELLQTCGIRALANAHVKHRRLAYGEIVDACPDLFDMDCSPFILAQAVLCVVGFPACMTFVMNYLGPQPEGQVYHLVEKLMSDELMPFIKSKMSVMGCPRRRSLYQELKGVAQSGRRPCYRANQRWGV